VNFVSSGRCYRGFSYPGTGPAPTLHLAATYHPSSLELGKKCFAERKDAIRHEIPFRVCSDKTGEAVSDAATIRKCIPLWSAKQSGSQERSGTFEVALWTTTESREAVFLCRDTPYPSDFRPLFNRLDLSLVAVAMSQETGLLGMEVRCSRSEDHSTCGTARMPSDGSNFSG
jgi:hypothetical protein